MTKKFNKSDSYSSCIKQHIAEARNLMITVLLYETVSLQHVTLISHVTFIHKYEYRIFTVLCTVIGGFNLFFKFMTLINIIFKSHL